MKHAVIYDDAIRAASAKYLPWDWRWIKAQLIAESNLDPHAVSSAGARGIAQFMPGTWTDALVNLGLPQNTDPFDAQAGIVACCWYMAAMRRVWRTPRPEDDRRRLAQASYNAGQGNVLHAQRLADYASDYATIIAHLPPVTGIANARQTTDYVARIESIYAELCADA